MLSAELRGLVERRHIKASPITPGIPAPLWGREGGWKAEWRILGSYLLMSVWGPPPPAVCPTDTLPYTLENVIHTIANNSNLNWRTTFRLNCRSDSCIPYTEVYFCIQINSSADDICSWIQTRQIYRQTVVSCTFCFDKHCCKKYNICAFTAIMVKIRQLKLLVRVRKITSMLRIHHCTLCYIKDTLLPTLAPYTASVFANNPGSLIQSDRYSVYWQADWLAYQQMTQ